MKSLNHIAMESRYGVMATQDLKDWAYGQIEKGGELPSAIYDIFGCSDEEACELALCLADELSGFGSLSAEAEDALAIEVLREYGEKLLRGECLPWKFCALVTSLENDFNCREGCFRVLTLLGDLYDACDYYDDSWTLENSPHLVEEVRRMLAKDR